jgi:hypothetical protein
MADQTIDIKFASELEERKKELVREQIDINWVTGTAGSIRFGVILWA